MKKKISLMLAAALTAGLALTGCGGSKTSDTTDNTAGAENESTAEVKGVDVDTTGLPGCGSERRYSDCGCAENFQGLRGAV